MNVNGYVYGVVWRLEARTNRAITQFIICNAIEINTIRQMHYIRLLSNLNTKYVLIIAESYSSHS